MSAGDDEPPGTKPRPSGPEAMLALYAVFRAWIRGMVAGANFRLAFASLLFAASTLLWPYIATITCVATSFSAVTFGALIGNECDVWMRARRARTNAAGQA